MSDRGGKVESLHSVEGHFSNGGMKPQTAQMNIEEGVVRFAVQHAAKLKFQRGECESPAAPHYRSWLRRESNALAVSAGMTVPYPDEPELPDDNHERFLSDYNYEQEKRKEMYDYPAGITRCPCDSCAERRKTCPCASCQSFRRESVSVDDQPLAQWLEANRDAASKLLFAASVELRRIPSNIANEKERSRQLEQLAGFICGEHYGQFLVGYRKCDIDVCQLIGYTPPASRPEVANRIQSTALTAPARGLGAGFSPETFPPTAPIGAQTIPAQIVAAQTVAAQTVTVQNRAPPPPLAVPIVSQSPNRGGFSGARGLI